MVSHRNIRNSTLSKIVLRDCKGSYRVVQSGTETVQSCMEW